VFLFHGSYGQTCGFIGVCWVCVVRLFTSAFLQSLLQAAGIAFIGPDPELIRGLGPAHRHEARDEVGGTRPAPLLFDSSRSLHRACAQQLCVRPWPSTRDAHASVAPRAAATARTSSPRALVRPAPAPPVRARSRRFPPRRHWLTAVSRTPPRAQVQPKGLAASRDPRGAEQGKPQRAGQQAHAATKPS
jgi:hypothetical protein